MEVSNVNRTAYVVLALFLGGIGVHNFYAKRGAIGGWQLAFNVLNYVLVYGGAAANSLAVVVMGSIGSIILFLWIIVEMITVTEDGDGYRMS